MKKYFSLFLALVMLVTAIPFASLTASAAELVKGDASGDGQVTAIDARFVLRHVAGLEKLTDAQVKAVDLSGDAKVTALDARMILREVAGLSNDIQANTDQMLGILRLFGYEYDAEQNIYYTSLNAWQRNFGFTDLYDNAAVFATMLYQTLKIDFEYNGLLWRLQWWKGQYGVLEGAEMGVYTKKPENIDSYFYRCAEDENLLEMYFEYYQTPSDYNAGKPLFTRYEQEHWWITGFKFGTCNPSRNVLKSVLIARDTAMADGIEEGLKNVTDKNGNKNGFVEYRPWLALTTSNYYTRTKLEDGRTRFDVVWKDAGYTNYGLPENPEGPSEDDKDDVEGPQECAHEYGAAVVKEKATCIKAGRQEKTCKNCKKVLSEEIPATGNHVAGGEWIVVTAPTVDTEGVKAQECIGCGMVAKTETMPKLEAEETPDEKPSVVPEEKPTETPEEKPTEVPEEKPTETPEEKPTETPEEKPTEAPEEKPTETPEEKPTEVPEEKPTETPDEEPSETSDVEPEEVTDAEAE